MGSMGTDFGWVFWIVLVGAVILVSVWSYSKRKKPHQRSEDPALDILKQRYARGEIGKAEFEEKKKELAK